MNLLKNNTTFISVGLTLIIFAVWLITGGDYYTKYEMVKEIEKELDPSDPLVAAGFYKDNKIIEIVTIDEFRLGLLPTPSGVFDKHIVAVVTLIGPVWFITFIIFLVQRRKKSVG